MHIRSFRRHCSFFFFRQSLQTLKTSISGIRVEDDVREYRRNYGLDMPFHIPPFEEYTESLHQVLRGQKLSKKLSSNYVGNGGAFRSLSNLNPFKGVSTSMLPSSTQVGVGREKDTWRRKALGQNISLVDFQFISFSRNVKNELLIVFLSPICLQDDDAEGPGDQVTVLRIVHKERSFDLTPSVDDNNNSDIQMDAMEDYYPREEELEQNEKIHQAAPFDSVVEELAERQQTIKIPETNKQVKSS